MSWKTKVMGLSHGQSPSLVWNTSQDVQCLYEGANYRNSLYQNKKNTKMINTVPIKNIDILHMNTCQHEQKKPTLQVLVTFKGEHLKTSLCSNLLSSILQS